jgi:hypothetical protein
MRLDLQSYTIQMNSTYIHTPQRYIIGYKSGSQWYIWNNGAWSSADSGNPAVIALTPVLSAPAPGQISANVQARANYGIPSGFRVMGQVNAAESIWQATVGGRIPAPLNQLFSRVRSAGQLAGC